MSGKDLAPTATMPGTVHVPLATEPVSAMDVEVASQALYNFCQALYYGKIVVQSGVTMLVNSGGAITCNGKMTLNGTGASATVIADASSIDVDDLNVNVSCDVVSGSLLTVKSGAAITMESASIMSTQGRIKHRLRANMTDADQTLDVATADQWQLDHSPVAKRTIKLQDSNAANDETITLIVPNQGLAAVDGDMYEIQRVDGTILANFLLLGGLNSTVWARFRFVGSSWVVDENVGFSYNPTASKYYGCRPA